MTKSVTIKAAKITGVFALVAAIIGGIFLLLQDRGNNQSSHVETGGNVEGLISVVQGAGPGTINYNPPVTATKEAIQELENRLDQTDTKIELTRKEIKLLADALRDLDQRTSGIEKLPDGRTKFGDFVSGEPSIVIQEHNTAVSDFQNNNFEKAFEHSQNAIKAFEETKKINILISTNSLPPETV